MTRMPLFLLSAFLATNAYSELPVVLTGPTPAIPGQIQPGFAQTSIYTVINNVPRMSAPLTVSGLSGPITRVPVANDCGNVLPIGPSSCNIGVLINPQPNNFGLQFQRTLLIDYQDRVPLRSTIEFTVSSQPAIFLAGGAYTNTFPFVVSSNDGAGAVWSVKPTSNQKGIYVTSSCVGGGSTAICVVLGTGQQTYVSTDGAATFTRQPAFLPPDPLLIQQTVSCTGDEMGDAFCVAGAETTGINPVAGNFFISVGKISSTQVSWRQHAVSPNFGFITNSSCSGSGSNSTCVLVGYNVKTNSRASNVFMVYTQDEGAHFSINFETPSTGPIRLNGVSCTGFGATANCVAVGGTHNTSIPLIYNTQNGGANWTLANNIPQLYYNSVSCTGHNTSLVCAAVGNSSTIAMSNDGVNWRSVASSPAVSQLLSVSCTGSGSTAVCAAGGTSTTGTPILVASNNGGNTWVVPTFTPPTGAPQFSSVSCTQDGPSSICIAGSGTLTPGNQPGGLLRSINPTVAWTAVTPTGLTGPAYYMTTASTE